MSPNIGVIQPSGVLDGTQSSQFCLQVNEAVTAGAEVVLINLKDVTFMDSSGLAALVIAFKAVQAAGRRMCICSVNEQVKMLFELTSMDKLLEIFVSQDEFVQAQANTGSIPLN